MIRYALACQKGHDFESWFPSSASFDAQVGRGLVECPVCGSAKVEKQLMAPALRTKATRPAPSSEAAPAAEAAPAPAEPVPERPETAPQPVVLFSEREQAVRAMLRAMREHVARTADYVGPSFADEARRMHYGETPHRSIYGEADALDAKALLEEGIEVHPLPPAPDDRN